MKHSTHSSKASECAGLRGFTLIELILVMAILTIAVSVTAPSLSNFFRGRTLDAEARRILALTRLGQSRAASEGVPVQLWIDAAQGLYGLETEPSYETTDAKREEFKLDGGMQIETIAYDPTSMDTLPGSTAPAPVNTMPANSARQNSGPHSALPKVKFLPDGTVDESSPQMIKLTGRDGFSIYVAQTRNRVNYEIRTRTSNN
jgi:type II secretion system protein H